MKMFKLSRALCIFLSAASLHALAEENMNFHGTLVALPSCTINNNEPINVEFGDVGVNKVDGVNYTKDIDYKISCDRTTEDGQLYLSVTGTGSDFNSDYLMTSVSGLGIEIKAEDALYKLNSQLKVDIASPPKLTAVPVKEATTSLAAGEFSAAATLQAFYQ